MNNHHYIPQAAPLKDIIHSGWQIEGAPSFKKENILPKGIIEIIFNFSEGSSITGQLGNRQFDLPKTFINGFNRVPIELHLPQHQKFLGIRLQPMGIKKLLGVPASEFTDSIVDLALIDSSFNSLWNQLAEQQDFESRIAVFSKWTERKTAEVPPQEKLINEFLYSAGQHTISVKELAVSVYYSPRHLSRKLYEATGMSTEEILLYKKYLHAVHLIHHSNFSLTEIAYESNFSDQSHFIKSFKAYTNMTPGEYSRQKSFLQGHIYENVR